MHKDPTIRLKAVQHFPCVIEVTTFLQGEHAVKTFNLSKRGKKLVRVVAQKMWDFYEKWL